MPETILLVDDEEMILDSLRTVLSKEGYQVDCAKSGNEALSILQNKNYDLVITDIRMPGMNGIEMVERVMKSVTPKPKIMVITGYGSLETAVKAQHRGVCDYLIKPIDVQSLRSSVRRALKPPHDAQTADTRQLESKLKDWAEYFTLMSDFTASLNASLDVHEIMEIAVDRLKKIAESECVSVYLFADVMCEQYYLKNISQMPAVSAGSGISTALAERGKWLKEPVVVSPQAGSGGAHASTTYAPLYEALAAQGLRHAFLMPVIVKNRVVGISDVCSDRQEPFTDVDITLFKTLVNQTSLALANAFSYLEVEERSKEIGLLYNLSLRLNQSLKITDSIKAICEGAVDVTGAAGSLLQTSMEPGSIKNFIFHRDMGFHKEMKRGSQDWLIPSSARKQAFYSNDPVMDPRVNSLALYSLGLRSLAYVPLIYEWEDMGGLTVFHKTEGRGFDQRDLHLLHLYARHASEVLLNSQLFEAIKKSREKVITEKNKMDIVLSNMADGVVNIGTNGKITYINGAMLSMLGREEGQALGKRCSEVFKMERCISDCPLRIGAYEKREQQFFEDSLVNDKGESMSVYVSFGPTFDSEGKVSGWVKVVRNMDKIKEVERLKDSFFHALAHDLRTPLTSLTGFLEILSQQQDLAEKHERFLRIMNDNVNDMNSIITDLLDVYKSKNASLMVRAEDVDIKALAQSAIKEMEVTARLKGISISGFEPGGPLRARADSDLIKRVLNNLLGNAIKFSPSGGRVRMTAKNISAPQGAAPSAADAAHPAVEVSIEDSGMGVPSGELDKIFDMFYQSKHAQDAKQSGTGLGLAISREIVEAHGGRIWAENVEGGGMRFTFTLPGKEGDGSEDVT